jgi:hypothetical protein
MLNKRLALPITIPNTTIIPDLQHKADALYMLNIDTNPVTKAIATNP